MDAVANGSFEHPFHTLAQMPAPVSGDAFYFKAGDTFQGSLKRFQGGANIVITSYARTKTAKRAIIRSGDATAIEFEGGSGNVVAWLKVIGSGADNNHVDGMRFFAPGTRRYQRFIVDHCLVSGFGGAGISFRANKTKPTGAHPNPSTTGFNYVEISNCSVTSGGDFGILVGDGGFEQAFNENGLPLGGVYSHEHISVVNCETSFIHGKSSTNAAAGSGILIAEASSVLVDNCVAAYNGDENAAGSGPFGIWFISVSHGVIQNCEAHHNIKTLTPASDIKPVDGGGFDLDNNCVNCVIEHNYSHDNGGAGYYIFDAYNDSVVDGPDWNANNIVRFNVSENDARVNEAGIMVGSRVKNAQIYNNTVYISLSGDYVGDFPSPAMWVRGKRYSGLDIHHNIFFADGINERTLRVENPGLDLTTSALPYIRLDYNNYFNPQSLGQKSISYLDLNTSTKVHPLRDLQRSTNGAQELHGTVVDPLFVGGEGKLKFKLRDDSPIAGVGAF